MFNRCRSLAVRMGFITNRVLTQASRAAKVILFFVSVTAVVIGNGLSLRELGGNGSTYWTTQAARAIVGRKQLNIQCFASELGQKERPIDGYNCKAKVWVGNLDVTPLFDTGATRNTMDFDFSVNSHAVKTAPRLAPSNIPM